MVVQQHSCWLQAVHLIASHTPGLQSARRRHACRVPPQPGEATDSGLNLVPVQAACYSTHLPVRRVPNRASWSSRPGADAGALEQNVARLFRDKVKFSLHVEFTQASILAGGVHSILSGSPAYVHFGLSCSCKAAELFTVSYQCLVSGCWSVDW